MLPKGPWGTLPAELITGVAMEADTLAYSARLVRPFVELLRGEPWVPPAVLQWLETQGKEDRVAAAPLHQLLELAASLSGDEYLGVRAARQMNMGDAGAVDFAIASAETLDDVMRTACRYMRLLADPVDFRFEVEGAQVYVHHLSTRPASRYVEDFQLCGFLWNHARLWPREVSEDLDVWFKHAEPTSREEYARTLGKARLHFGAATSGFSFAAAHLLAKLPASDVRLHDVLRAHADALLTALPRRKSHQERVRELLLKQLANGDLRASTIAKKLHVSQRTLVRRLAEEGTTFSQLLDDARRDLALRHVGMADTNFTEVAFLTGFADAPSFYRAFRRWTEMTPAEYRRQHGR